MANQRLHLYSMLCDIRHISSQSLLCYSKRQCGDPQRGAPHLQSKDTSASYRSSSPNEFSIAQYCSYISGPLQASVLASLASACPTHRSSLQFWPSVSSRHSKPEPRSTLYSGFWAESATTSPHHPTPKISLQSSAKLRLRARTIPFFSTLRRYHTLYHDYP